MNHTWQPALLQDDEIDDVVELCQLQPGKSSAVTAEYITWQRDANPVGQAQVGVAKEFATGKILGLVWFIPLRIQVGSEVILGSQSLYALVHPDHRGKGIFSTLVPFCYHAMKRMGVQFSYGLPNQKSYPPFINRLGWEHIGAARLWLRPINTRRLVSRRFGKGFFPWGLSAIGHLAGNLILSQKPINADNDQLTITKVSPLDPLFDEFWQQVRAKYSIMLVRDTAFLNWRYAKIPDREYQLLAAIHHGKMLAYIVLREVLIQGISCGMIVDFLVAPTSQGFVGGEILVRETLTLFQSHDLDLVGCMMLPGVEETKILSRQGLILCPSWLQPQPIPVILQADRLSPKWYRLSQINNWFLTMGDHDAA
jgi:predicted N-acetyltransferase YhbS